MEIDIDHIKTVDGPVTTKHCIDCMEHKHSMEDKTTSIIVCGTSTENKLSNGAETLSNITLTFKSDGSVVQQGADFFIIENQIAGEETKNGLYLNPGVTNEAKSQVNTSIFIIFTIHSLKLQRTLSSDYLLSIMIAILI